MNILEKIKFFLEKFLKHDNVKMLNSAKSEPNIQENIKRNKILLLKILE